MLESHCFTDGASIYIFDWERNNCMLFFLKKVQVSFSQALSVFLGISVLFTSLPALTDAASLQCASGTGPFQLLLSFSFLQVPHAKTSQLVVVCCSQATERASR
jgi:hypothetical protein